MPLIAWDEKFAVGIAAVDHEHRALVDLINKTYEQLMCPGQERVAEFLGEIYARIAAHFALEESLMASRHYDRFREHKADHERLLEQIRDIMDDYEDGDYFDEYQLGERLRVWFTAHFGTHDARLHGRLG